MHSEQVSGSVSAGVAGGMGCKGTQGNLGGWWKYLYLDGGGGFMEYTCNKTYQIEHLK